MKIVQIFLFIALFIVLPLVADDSDWDDSIHNTEKVSFQVQTYIDGFDIPWGMAFMPDKRMLVTDRIGDIWIVAKDGTDKVKVIGEVPIVRSKGQGGMLDVEIHPDFINNSFIYLTYSDISDNKFHTSLIRAKLINNQLVDSEVIFRPKEQFFTKKPIHYGSRIVFDDNGFIYFSTVNHGYNIQTGRICNPPAINYVYINT